MAGNVLTGEIRITTSGAEAAFKRVGQSAAATESSLKKVGQSAKLFEGSLETLQARIGARKSFLNVETDINKIKKLNQEISLLELQVTHLSNVGKTSFNKFGQAVETTSGQLKNTVGGINQINLSISGMGGAAQKAIAGLLRISYLLPGIGFAGIVGGIGTVVGALFGLGGAVDKTVVDFSQLDAAAKAAIEVEKKFQEEVTKASGSVLQQAGSLKDLKAILIDVTNQTHGLTTATINQGVAQFLFDKKNLAVQELLSAEIAQQIDLRKKQRPFADVQEFTVAGESKNPFTKRIAQAKDGIRQINDLSFGLAKQINDLFNKAFTKPIKIDKAFIPKFPDLLPVKLKIVPTFDDTAFKNAALGIKTLTFAEALQKKFSDDIAKLVVAPHINLSPEALANIENQKKMTEAANTLGESFRGALQTSLSDGLSSIGEGLGNILAGNDFGDQFAQVFASLFNTIGKALIKFGIVKEGLDKILGPGGIAIPGGLAIGLGIFAIAAGQLMKSVSGKRADGGPVVGGKSYLVGERGPEIFTPNTGGGITANHQLGGRSGGMAGGFGGNVVFKIAGKELIGVLALAQQSQNRLT